MKASATWCTAARKPTDKRGEEGVNDVAFFLTFMGFLCPLQRRRHGEHKEGKGLVKDEPKPRIGLATFDHTNCSSKYEKKKYRFFPQKSKTQRGNKQTHRSKKSEP